MDDTENGRSNNDGETPHHHHRQTIAVEMDPPQRWVQEATDGSSDSDGDGAEEPRPVRTIFFQGMGMSQVHLANYTGNWGFEGTTGESFRHPLAMEAIRYPFVGPELPEVVLSPARMRRDLWTACRHPLLCLGWNFTDLVYDMYGFRAAPMGCCLPAATSKDSTGTVRLTLQHHALRMDRVNVGQDGDIAAHFDKWKALQYLAKRERCQEKQQQQLAPKDPAKDKGKEKVDAIDVDDVDPVLAAELRGFVEPCILYGVSRGAAATLNALATHRYDGVRLVVLEGCFDTVKSALHHQVGPLVAPVSEFFLSLLTDYSSGGPTPLGMASRVPTHIPVAFVTSLADNEVPWESTVRVAEEMRAAGHERVHVLKLRRSRHPHYVMDNQRDRDAYTYWLHALYKLYHLAYVPEYAEQGEDLLDESEDGGQDRWFAREASEDSDSATDDDGDDV